MADKYFISFCMNEPSADMSLGNCIVETSVEILNSDIILEWEQQIKKKYKASVVTLLFFKKL